MIDVILCTLLLSFSSGLLYDIEVSKSSYYYAPGLAWCLTTWAFTINCLLYRLIDHDISKELQSKNKNIKKNVTTIYWILLQQRQSSDLERYNWTNELINLHKNIQTIFHINFLWNNKSLKCNNLYDIFEQNTW